MSENFKRRPHLDGPDPYLEHGNPNLDIKSSGGKGTKQKHGQDPHLEKRPTQSGAKHAHEPPVTPHHVTKGGALQSPVKSSGTPMRINPSPKADLIKRRDLSPEKVLPQGSQQWGATHVGTGEGKQRKQPNVDGDRKQPGGGESMRPNVPGQSAPAAVRTAMPQPRTVSGTGPAPMMKHPQTRKIRGMIGKPGKKKNSWYL